MGIQEKLFGTMPDGSPVDAYTLQNKNGTSFEVIPYGCRLTRIFAKDKNGHFKNVILGFDTLQEYMTPSANFHGTTVGRYANRIANARFVLDGKTISLSRNDGANTLHGGPCGFHQVLWDITSLNDSDTPSISFSYLSADGEEGYPGTLSVTVTYSLSSDDAIRIEYIAETDKPTAVNFTNHSYFNLFGNLSTDVLSTVLQINSDFYTAASDDLIPTGQLLSVAGTPFDFRVPKAIGKDLFAKDRILELSGGYDHNFAVNGTGFRRIATAYEPENGRVLEISSDLPGVQLYTCNRATPEWTYTGNTKAIDHQAFCLETQFFPDSPNHPEFPFEFLRPGKKFRTVTEYKFSVK